MHLQIRKKFIFFTPYSYFIGTQNFVLFHDTKAAREQPVCGKSPSEY